MRRFGIDLGTTNTCIYYASFPVGGDREDFNIDSVNIYYENKGDSVNPPLLKQMPSAIYGRQKNDGSGYEFFLGEIAVREARNDGAPEIINTKRLLCQEDPTREIAYGLTAQDIAQKLLEGCCYSLKQRFNERVRNTAQYCITQPAAFGLFASRSIQDAAGPAGFANAEAQKEPIAALLSFLYRRLEDPEKAREMFDIQKRKNGRLLTIVVDIGGGTTVVTIQEISVGGTEEPEQGSLMCTGYKIKFLNQAKDGGRREVAAANLEPAFGGYDFDKMIVRHVVEKLNSQYSDQMGRDYNWNSMEGRNEISGLFQRMQDYKIRLSSNGQPPYEENVFLDGCHLSCSVSAEEVYSWTRELCEAPLGQEGSRKTVCGIIEDTIRRSGYRVGDIDYFFVTGGMSSFKPIRDMLKRRFKGLYESGRLMFSDSPLEDIARGAAVCNCYFSVEMPQSVLYADLMIDNPCGEPQVLAEKNQALPVENTTERFMKLSNPAYLYLDILWGLGWKDSLLKRLRRLRKPLPNGKVTPIGTDISVHYKIDKHQAMDIELIVHDPRGEYKVTLLNLIKDVNLSGGDTENA